MYARVMQGLSMRRLESLVPGRVPPWTCRGKHGLNPCPVGYSCSIHVGAVEAASIVSLFNPASARPEVCIKEYSELRSTSAVHVSYIVVRGVEVTTQAASNRML
jgi:hypothetical protein